MVIRHYVSHDNLDIKIKYGNLLINVIYINFVPASPHWNVANHSHSSYELHFIPQGKGILVVNQNKYDIGPGTFFLTGPRVYHEQFSDREDPMCEYCINFDYRLLHSQDPDDPIPAKETQELSRILGEVSFWFGKDKYKNLELFERMYEEFTHQMAGYYSSIKNYTSQIIINSLRCFLTQPASYVPPKKTLDDNRRHTLDDLFAYHYASITMEQMAKALGVSKRQLDRIIHQFYSSSFKDKLSEIRIENSIHLLKTTDLNIEEISKKMGFTTSSYFCRAFKKLTGRTPSSYR